MAREAGLEEAVRLLVEIRLADLEEARSRICSTRSACRLRSCSSVAARASGVRQRGRRWQLRLYAPSSSPSSGSTRISASGGTNSGGPPTRVATTVRPGGHRLEDRLPERLDQRRRADDAGGGQVAQHLLAGTRPARATFSRPSKPRSQRPITIEGQGSLAEVCECIGEAHDVLALGEAAGHTRTRGYRRWRVAAPLKRARSTPESTTSVLSRASAIFSPSSRR